MEKKKKNETKRKLNNLDDKIKVRKVTCKFNDFRNKMYIL